MRYSLVCAALAVGQLALAGPLVPRQAVEEEIKPEDKAPDGCEGDVEGKFYLAPKYVDEKKEGDEKKSERRKRSEEANVLECEIAKGIIKDIDGKTGYIASNYQ
jgi:hypothetical protein